MMPGFTGHGPWSVRLLSSKNKGKQPLKVVSMSENKETTFMAQATTQVEEGCSSQSERDEATTARAWCKDGTSCVPSGLNITTDLEGGERFFFRYYERSFGNFFSMLF